MFEIPAGLLAWFYEYTDSYIIAIALMSVVVMAITTPLTLKSTKGMLEMQRIAPEMRRLQNEHRNDKQKLNEEMMKLYSEHKVNPASSCLPLLAQMPVFIVMFRVLRGLTYQPTGEVRPITDTVFDAVGRPDEIDGFVPRFLSTDSDLYLSLYGKQEMRGIGLNLGESPFEVISRSPGQGIFYALLVVVLGVLYFAQQRMVAARAAVSPTMSPTQQKLMQYLPVVFAVFQIFFVTSLVVYYIFQTLLRIAQQYYVTKKFYGGDESLGRQAQRAGEEARAASKASGETGGLFSQARRDLMGGDSDDAAPSKSPRTGGPAGKKKGPATGRPTGQSKRVTPPKARPGAAAGPAPGGKGRPTPSRKEAQERRERPKKSTRTSRPSSGRSGRKRR
ncbi:membrane protein insertase YidC [Ilumatobacter sp.]|uniref:membrane protein insertase YidC n=1 Tax=Ilumatobacter sp. TaxID=1967498 RepID=UPI003B51D8C3